MNGFPGERAVSQKKKNTLFSGETQGPQLLKGQKKNPGHHP
jgi:hypothetical protein